MLKFEQKHAIGLSFTEGLNMKDECIELEVIEASCDPEDVHTFLQTFMT